MEIFYKTISELESMLDSKEISAVELAKAVIERKNSVDGKVGAFLSANEDELLAEASISDSLRAEGKKRGALEGIPIGLKDVLAVRGQKLTCASKILENYVSPYTASSLEKLKSRGGIFWGRLNMDEFAMGSSCENSAFQPTHNPWDLSRIPGGSSIRQPASLCGVVGMKPTYGLVSRYGLAAFASSLDQIGPFARCVKDAAILLEAVAGHDPKDSTSVDCEIPDYASNISLEAFKGAKIGIPKEYFGAGIDPEVKAIVEKAIADCASQGAEIVEISLPHTDLAIPVYYIIATAEASSNLARYDGVRYTRRSPDTTDAIDIYYKSRAEGFGEEVKRRIILGSYVLSSGYYDAYYLRAQKVRTLIRRDFEAAFEKVDVIMTPTSPTTAFKIGEKTSDPLSMYLSDICTINVNLAGLPGISVPCGFSDAGLPVGLQMIGKAFDERNLLSFAASYEAAHEWASRRPTL